MRFSARACAASGPLSHGNEFDRCRIPARLRHQGLNDGKLAVGKTLQTHRLALKITNCYQRTILKHHRHGIERRGVGKERLDLRIWQLLIHRDNAEFVPGTMSTVPATRCLQCIIGTRQSDVIDIKTVLLPIQLHRIEL